MFHADAQTAYISVKKKRFIVELSPQTDGTATSAPNTTAALATPATETRVRSHPARAPRRALAAAGRAR